MYVCECVYANVYACFYVCERVSGVWAIVHGRVRLVYRYSTDTHVQAQHMHTHTHTHAHTHTHTRVSLILPPCVPKHVATCKLRSAAMSMPAVSEMASEARAFSDPPPAPASSGAALCSGAASAPASALLASAPALRCAVVVCAGPATGRGDALEPRIIQTSLLIAGSKHMRRRDSPV